MPTITFEGKTTPLPDGVTVLDALLGAGHDVPHQCRAGACQSCLLRATTGAPPAASQQGLKSTLKAQGYFLSCVAKPTQDLDVVRADNVVSTVPASIERIEKLSPDVARVLIACHSALDYKPGQFISLVRPDGLSRSYSLASLPGRDPHIELHVRKVPGGQISTWVHDHARSGDPVTLRGPSGDCFYVEGDTNQPLLLVGTGTGLAPLYAIAQDALRQSHAGPIHLYHGALKEEGLYLVNELQDLARRHRNFTYTRCLVEGTECDGVCVGDLEKIVLGRHKSLKGRRAFLCGNPALVQSLRKKTFIAGAKLNEIHSDAFVPATK